MIQGLFYSKLIHFQIIHKKFLDLLDEESVSGESSGRASL